MPPPFILYLSFKIMKSSLTSIIELLGIAHSFSEIIIISQKFKLFMTLLLLRNNLFFVDKTASIELTSVREKLFPMNILYCSKKVTKKFFVLLFLIISQIIPGSIAYNEFVHYFKNWNKLVTASPFLVREEPPVFLCLSHKSASTILKYAILYNITQNTKYESNIMSEWPHGKYIHPRQPVGNILHKAQDSSSLFFMISRHPINRVVSAFMDKILSHDCDRFKPKGYRCSTQSFELFVKSLIRDPQVNDVFKLQTDGCFFENLKEKYFILKIENMKEWIGDFSSTLNMHIDKRLWKDKTDFIDLNHYTGSRYMEKRYVDENMKLLLCRWAQKDLVYLNYTC